MRRILVFLWVLGLVLSCQNPKTSVLSPSGYLVVQNDQGRPWLEVANKDLPGLLNFEEAQSVCDSMGEGWRLPEREELQAMRLQLHRKKQGDFQNKWYWSATPNTAESYWGLHFGNGLEYYNFKTDHGCVRLVRDFRP